jgi:hypothetical protein
MKEDEGRGGGMKEEGRDGGREGIKQVEGGWRDEGGWAENHTEKVASLTP